MNSIKDRLKEAETTIPGIIGMVLLVVVPVYDALKQAYGQLLSMGIQIEITDITMLKAAVGLVFIWMIFTKIRGTKG